MTSHRRARRSAAAGNAEPRAGRSVTVRNMMPPVPAAGTSTWLGPAACLGAAALWAGSLTLFRRPIVLFGARRINAAKCTIAALLQGLTVLALGQGPALLAAPRGSLGLIATSGLIGLFLGDTALFSAASRLGVHRALLLQTLSPVFAAVVAAAWLGERPTAVEVAGSAVILAGIALVVAPPRRDVTAPASGSPWSPAGIALGVLAALGQGSGLVLAKAGMEHLPVVAASFLRLAAAAAGLSLAAAAAPRRPAVEVPEGFARVAGRVLAATLLGTYVALFLSMAGIALAPASVAAVLLATSPVFVLVLEAAVLGRTPPLRAWVGTAAALAGVALLAA